MQRGIACCCFVVFQAGDGIRDYKVTGVQTCALPISGLGTSGTFVGTARRLKELNPAIRCVSLQPDASFHGLEGWKHMPTAIRPAIYDDTLADENLGVSTEEAYRLVKKLAREEGLLVSPSAAAALLGCFKVAAGIPKNDHAVMVTVFADSASKYLNERFWDEE